MATIILKQGDATTITETITGLSALTGYTPKLYIKTMAGVEVDTVTGSVNGLVVSYDIVNEDSKVYPIGMHRYETKIFDDSDHVYTPSEGYFIVESALNTDPA